MNIIEFIERIVNNRNNANAKNKLDCNNVMVMNSFRLFLDCCVQMITKPIFPIKNRQKKNSETKKNYLEREQNGKKIQNIHVHWYSKMK